MDPYFTYRLTLFILEWVAAFSGLLMWQQLSGKGWRPFVIYLFVVAVTETFAEVHFARTQDAAVNSALYNYFLIPLQFLFLFWFFYKEFRPAKQSVLPLGCSLLYVLSWFVDYFFLSTKRFVFQSFSYTLGNILLLILVLVFFIRLVNSKKLLTFYQQRMFWVSCGLVLFYLGSLPFYGLWNTLAFDYPVIFNQYWLIQMFLNYGMYLLFTIAFLWPKEN